MSKKITIRVPERRAAIYRVYTTYYDVDDLYDSDDLELEEGENAEEVYADSLVFSSGHDIVLVETEHGYQPGDCDMFGSDIHTPEQIALLIKVGWLEEIS